MLTMKSPKVGRQRSASGAFSLSRSLPKIALPPSGIGPRVQRPRPQVGKPMPGKPVKGGRHG
jgi:hypothetical protein